MATLLSSKRLLIRAPVTGLAFMGGISQMTWYVSYATGGGISDERAHRATKTFATEHGAKEFARARSIAGDKSLIAGTINPVTPKRVIPSASIPDWLDDESKN